MKKKPDAPRFDADPLDDDEDAPPFTLDDSGSMVLNRGLEAGKPRRAAKPQKRKAAERRKKPRRPGR